MVRFSREPSSFALTVDHRNAAACPPRVVDATTFYTLEAFSRDNDTIDTCSPDFSAKLIYERFDFQFYCE